MTNLNTKISSAFDSIRTIAKNALSNSDVFVSNEKKEERLSICESCSSFNKTIRQCKECGCFMDLKAGLVGMVCLKDLWNDSANTTQVL